MDSSIIGKIEKARHYAEQKDRVSITSFAATFQGNHNQYDVHFEDGAWRCPGMWWRKVVPPLRISLPGGLDLNCI